MGAADLIVQNVKAENVYLASSGASRIFLLNSEFPGAKVKTAHVAAGGTSSAFVFGADNVDVLLEGTADVAVDGGRITGASLGANSVFAVAANTTLCRVAGPFGDSCVGVRGRLANRLSPPVFTCGIAAVGPFSCPLPGGGQVEGSAERMGAQAPSPSLAEGGVGAAPSPSIPEIATGGKRRRLSQQQQQRQQQQQMKGAISSAPFQATPQIPVLEFRSSVAFMRHCGSKFEDLVMAGAKVEESA